LKALYTENNYVTLGLSKNKDLEDRLKDHWTDKLVRPKQIIFWSNFVTRV